MGGPSSTIQGPVFWSFDGTTSIHKGHGYHSNPVPSERDSTSQIPRRLAHSGKDTSRGSGGHQQRTTNNRAVRPPSKLAEVGSSPIPEDPVPGYRNRYCRRQSTTSSKENRPPVGTCATVQGLRPSIGMGLAPLAGTSCILGKIGALGSYAPKIPPISVEGILEPVCQCQEDHGPYNKRSHSGPHMVGGSRQSPQRRSLGNSPSRSPAVHRRLHPGVGCPSPRPASFRPLGPIGDETAHQSSGAEGSEVRPPVLFRPLQGENCAGHVRQLDSSVSLETPRRNQVLEHVSEDPGPAQVVIREQHHSTISLHPRSTKRTGRPAEQKGPGAPSRVVITSRGLSSSVESLGSSSCGPVRHQTQSQAPCVLFPNSGSSGLVNRCHDDTLGQPLCLCIPSSSSGPESLSQAGPVQEHPLSANSSSLASTALVSRPAVYGHRSSKKSTSLEVPPETTSHGQVSSNTRNIPISRVDAIQRGIRARGFSEKAAARMSRPNRKSTLDLYQSKWSQFCDWCRQKQTNPLQASVPLVADFFIFLRESKKLSCPAIKGYRSALAQVLIQRGVDISSSPEISLLFKNFDQEIPDKTIPTPKWDLNIVLQSLLRAPYEPISNCSLKNLTLKTVFLLSLASAKRVSELHGLSYLVKWSTDKSSATLTLTHDFIAKTQTPGDPSTAYDPVVIPALASSVGQDDLETLLCPLRALDWYLRKTSPSRPHCSKLFVSTSSTRNHRPISKNTISHWIRSVIKTAYSSVPQEDLQLWKVSAHEVRALATSLLFKHNHSIKQVMAAASWRSNSTFASFYLRDLNHQYLDVSSVGPIVAAQAVIPPVPCRPSSSRQDQPLADPRQKKKRGGPRSKSSKRSERR